MKRTAKYLFVLLLVLLAFLLGYAVRVAREPVPVIYKPEIKVETQRVLDRLERKHGKRNTMVLWQEWHYINERGQKCTLK